MSEAVLAEAFNFPICVALSSDGASLVTGTAAGEVWLWRVSDRTPLLALQGHTGQVHDLALSEDGRLLASGSADGTARLWETASGRLLATLQGHTGTVWGVSLSADGRLLASGGMDQTVRLWEAPFAVGDAAERWAGRRADFGHSTATPPSGGRLLATLRSTGGVCGLALSRDGRLLASGGADGTVQLWETLSGRLLATLQGHTGPVYGLALSPDGGLLASGSWDGTVRLWETGSGRLLVTLQG